MKLSSNRLGGELFVKICSSNQIGFPDLGGGFFNPFQFRLPALTKQPTTGPMLAVLSTPSDIARLGLKF